MIFGIDPGLGGALVLLRDDGSLLFGQRTPLVAGDFDVRRMDALLAAADQRHEVVRAAVELVGAHAVKGQQSPSAMFSFGRGVGIWHTLIHQRGYPRVDVAPQDWSQLTRHLPRAPKAPPVPVGGLPEERLTAGRLQRAAARRRKENAVKRAIELCPALAPHLMRQADWALADAFLIAEWARRQVAGAEVQRAPAT